MTLPKYRFRCDAAGVSIRGTDGMPKKGQIFDPNTESPPEFLADDIMFFDSLCEMGYCDKLDKEVARFYRNIRRRLARLNQQVRTTSGHDAAIKIIKTLTEMENGLKERGYRTTYEYENTPGRLVPRTKEWEKEQRKRQRKLNRLLPRNGDPKRAVEFIRALAEEVRP